MPSGECGTRKACRENYVSIRLPGATGPRRCGLNSAASCILHRACQLSVRHALLLPLPLQCFRVPFELRREAIESPSRARRELAVIGIEGRTDARNGER